MDFASKRWNCKFNVVEENLSSQHLFSFLWCKGIHETAWNANRGIFSCETRHPFKWDHSQWVLSSICKCVNCAYFTLNWNSHSQASNHWFHPDFPPLLFWIFCLESFENIQLNVSFSLAIALSPCAKYRLWRLRSLHCAIRTRTNIFRFLNARQIHARFFWWN